MLIFTVVRAVREILAEANQLRREMRKRYPTLDI